MFFLPLIALLLWIDWTGLRLIFPDINSLWREPLVIPSYFALLSITLILLRLLWGATSALRARLFKSSSTASDSKPQLEVFQSYQHSGFLSSLKATIASHGGLTLFLFRVVRFISCLALVTLSVVSFVAKEGEEQGLSVEDGSGFLNALTKGMGKGKKKRRKQAMKLEHEEWVEMIQCAFYVRCLGSLFSPERSEGC